MLWAIDIHDFLTRPQKESYFWEVNMSAYNLKSNESLILKADRVVHCNSKSNNFSELLLTNLHIVLIASKGIFGNNKSVQTFPIKQIKIFNGQAQVKLGKQRNGSPQIEVFFLHSQETFGFEKKKEAMNWIDNISQLLTGKAAEFTPAERAVIPGTEVVAETFKSTIDVFKGTFGMKTKADSKEVTEVNLTKKCVSCRAPLTGGSSQKITCHYCDTEQTLG